MVKQIRIDDVGMIKVSVYVTKRLVSCMVVLNYDLNDINLWVMAVIMLYKPSAQLYMPLIQIYQFIIVLWSKCHDAMDYLSLEHSGQEIE